METKPAVQSKTIILNLISTVVAVATAVGGEHWVSAYPKVTAGIGAVLFIANIGLRFLTNSPVSLTGAK